MHAAEEDKIDCREIYTRELNRDSNVFQRPKHFHSLDKHIYSEAAAQRKTATLAERKRELRSAEITD